MVERYVRDVEAAGSNPVTPIFEKDTSKLYVYWLWGVFIFLKHIRKLFKIFYILPSTKNVIKNRLAGNQVLLNSTQLISFLKNAETMKGTDEYNDIEVFLHYEPDKGHNGLNLEDAISFLYQISEKNKQGDIFMENFFEPETECKTEQVGCPTMGYQDVNVCVPVTIKAFGEVGNATTKCLGNALITSGCNPCVSGPGNICKFTVSQKLRIEVPIIFGARAEADEAIIDCDCDCDCDSDCDDRTDERKLYDN